MIRLRTLAFIATLLLLSVLQAREASYVHYTVDEGLPSNEVYDVYEDSLGYIWFATDHGISRFDGYEFKNYSTNDGLTHNTIFGFYEDHRGWIWMRAFNGTMCYMREGKIFPYRHNDKLQKFLLSDFVQRFAFDKAGNFWFIPSRSEMGLYVQDAVTGEIRKVAFPNGYNACIRVFDSGEFIGGVDLSNGFSETSLIDDAVMADQQTWYFKMPLILSGYRRQLIHCRQTGPQQFVFVYEQHLALVENGSITLRQTFSDLVFGYYVDSTEHHWVSIDGFSKFHPGSAPESPYLAGHLPSDVLQDRMQNHWFATLDNGVFLARDLQVSVLNSSGEKTFDNVLQVESYDSFLMIMDNQHRFFRLPRNTSAIYSSETKCWSAPFAVVHAFCIAGDNICVGHYRYDLTADGIDSSSGIILASGGMPAGVRDYYADGNSFLAAGNRGWVLLDSTFHALYESFDDTLSGFCTAIIQDPRGQVWIGTSNGLYCHENNSTQPYRPSDSLFRQRVTDLARGPGGELIISTRGGGIIIVDGERTYTIRSADGLASDQCGNVCIDDSTVWIASNSGLTKMTMMRRNGALTFAFQLFNHQHGLPSEMINGVLRDGRELFLATGHGLAWFDPDAFHFNAISPPVYITSFQVNSHEINTDTAALQWSDRNISIAFIGLLYKSPGIVRYRYKLEGYEQEWHYTTERVAHYFNLTPGAYRFVVSAMNENGVWNELPAVREFVIPAHFTETAWFRLLIVALIMAVLAVIVFLFFRQQKTKAKAALDLAIAEQKALRAQMKPHFIFNSLNSIQNFIINRDEESAHVYLTSFAQLMRRILDHSRTSTIALQEELDTLRIYLDLEQLRFGDNFRYTIDNQTRIPATMLMIPPLFLQPFVENAIWHGLQLQKNDPVLRLHFSIENNKLHCVIEDNGIGRKRAAEFKRREHVSTGMKNVEERVAVLNATSREKISVSITDLSDADGNAVGTRVEILFPVVRNDED